jgi:hypothetical protein
MLLTAVQQLQLSQHFWEHSLSVRTKQVCMLDVSAGAAVGQS